MCIQAALGTGSDAIHPGYGFLAEQPQLADLCSAHGLIFVGPKADHIRKMGDKLYARKMVEGLGGSIIPGSELVLRFEEAAEAAGIEYELEKVTDINRITAAGIIMTPALAVDGEIKIVGKVPDIEEIKKLIS